MRYPPSLLDEIRTRLPLSAVVGKRVKLIRAGREHKGLSPFNAERTPSFYVNDHKQFYHCFSSGKHGDIFTFLIETEGLSFPEAVERLADEAGVPLPRVSAEAEAQEKKRATLSDALEWAAQHFEASLRGAAGVAAREYLKKRGLPAEVIREFRLGYAPAERHGLRDHLAGKGVEPAVMIEAGLLVEREGTAVPYDRFRDRVMFPICDPRGRVIAFGGRALAADAQAKYLNSPETPLFHKGHVLFNHHRARKAVADKGTVVVVEGYMDAIAMTRAGVPHVVAPLGTALTEDQLALLWRMTPEPVLCFDGDKAGQRAAHRAIDVALPRLGSEQTLRFAFLPEGQDPDDLLRNEGAEAIAHALGRAEPLVDVLWSRELDRKPLTTPEARADLERRLRDLSQLIADEPLRRHYRAEFAARVSALSTPSRGGSQRGPARGQTGRQDGRPDQRGRGPFRPGAAATPSLRATPVTISAGLRRSALFGADETMPAREVALVMSAINHPAILQAEAERLVALEFRSRDLSRLAASLVDLAFSAEEIDVGGVAEHLAAAGLDAARRRAEASLNSAEWWALPGANAADARLAWLQAADLHGKSGALHRELGEVEADLGDEATEANYQRMRAVRIRIAAVEDGAGTVDSFGPASGRD